MQITYENKNYDCSDEYSFKDYTNIPSVAIKNGEKMYASCFLQEIPDSHIFPDNLTGTTFIKCHLENVFIPEGNTVIDCYQERFKVQNDGNDWLIDTNDLPTLPVNHKIFTKFELPMPLVADIPTKKVKEPIDLIAVAKSKL